MRKILAAVLVVFVFSVPAYSWNDHGHMAVVRLAAKRLTDDQRWPHLRPPNLRSQWHRRLPLRLVIHAFRREIRGACVRDCHHDRRLRHGISLFA